MEDQNQFRFGKLLEFLIETPKRMGLNQLTAVTGFASAAVNRQLLYDYPELRLRLLIGMAKVSGIPDADHRTYCELAKNFPERFEAQYYIGRSGVHAKMYIWSRGNTPMQGIIASANLSWSGLLVFQEAGVYTDPAPLLEAYNHLRSSSISVLSSDVPRYVRIFAASASSARDVNAAHGAVKPSAASVGESVTLPLLSSAGEIHTRSGLNWGQREGREPNQAYIPIPASVHQEHSGFFPPRRHRFIVKTDDGEIMTCVVAQDSDKAVETPDDNSELGSYFRRRLGVPSGEFVSRDDLTRYGRTSVDFIKLDDDLFFLDFFKT